MLLMLSTYGDFSFIVAYMRFLLRKRKDWMLPCSIFFHWFVWRQSKDRRRRMRRTRKKGRVQNNSLFIHSFGNSVNHFRQDFEASFLFSLLLSKRRKKRKISTKIVNFTRIIMIMVKIHWIIDEYWTYIYMHIITSLSFCALKNDDDE